MQSSNTDQLVQQTTTLGIHETIKAYIAISKPGIVGLTIVAALTGIYIGNQGVIADLGMIAWLFLTLGLATAGSCMLNNVYDRDIDQLMGRTSKRPLATGIISADVARILGVGLSVIPLFVMAATVNVAAALLTAGAVFGYVVVYTMISKRHTPWANQLGGIAGAMPPVIGYAAVTGGVDIFAGIMFLIMALWQQPHALSLALKYRGDYAKANVPVIPVAKGVRMTKWRIAIYTAILYPIALLPYFYDMAGMIYLVTAIVLNTIFLQKAVRFLLSDKDYDMSVFFFSLIYLIVLFLALVWDFTPAMSV